MFKVIALSDFTDQAHNALLLAMRLAQMYSGEIILIHAMEQVPVPATAPIEVYAELFQTDKEKNLEKLREQIQNAFLELGIRHREVLYQLMIVSTPLAETVIELSEKLDATLIVMGSSASGGLERLLMGSDTTHMVDLSTKPLLIVPVHTNFKGFTNITFLIDSLKFQPRPGTDLLTRIIRTYSAHLHFLIISENKDEIILDDFLREYNFLIEEQDYSLHICSFTSSTCQKDLEQQLRQTNADLLVVFPKKRNLWQELFTSSITDEVAMKATTPLLVLPKHSA